MTTKDVLLMLTTAHAQNALWQPAQSHTRSSSAAIIKYDKKCPIIFSMYCVDRTAQRLINITHKHTLTHARIYLFFILFYVFSKWEWGTRDTRHNRNILQRYGDCVSRATHKRVGNIHTV